MSRESTQQETRASSVSVSVISNIGSKEYPYIPVVKGET
jgi:hypothetical protein